MIGLRQSGASYTAIAAQVGLSRTRMFNICKRFAAKGETRLASGTRGHKRDEQGLLTTAQGVSDPRPIAVHRAAAVHKWLAKLPTQVRGYFHQKSVRYAA